jgi:NDP-sugar pyrophosphorylase family protein
MEAFIGLHLFTNRETLTQRGIFPENALDLLGSALKGWLGKELDRLGVGDQPVIKGHVDPGALVRGAVYVAEGATIEWGALVEGPAIIGPGACIRQGAYLRGQVYMGAHSVLGHSSEAKGSVFLDGAKAPHLSYVGDSILCQNVNLGAGTKMANVLFDKTKEVIFKDPESGRPVKSGLKKFSAILGDSVQTGCNAVILPGSLLFPHTGVYPCHSFYGTLKKGFARPGPS